VDDPNHVSVFLEFDSVITRIQVGDYDAWRPMFDQDRPGAREMPPSNFYAAEAGAVEVTEQLIRDAGYHPVSVGGLENARMLEDHLTFMSAISDGLGRFFYRYAKPGEL